MVKYDNDVLYELCSSVDLLEYANQTMDFEKRGSDSYACHCPLHSDNTPSLFISPSKNCFYCQSCHVGGNILNWMMTFENLTFPEAVDKLTKLAGIDIQQLKISESLAFYKMIYHAMQQSKLPCDTTERSIVDENYMEQFLDEPPQEWLNEGISAATMKRFGIRIDQNANRIVYPVYDNDLRLIGAKGRTRFEKYKELKIRKYQNYQKIGTTDYFAGMKENREAILECGEAIIFEGIKSVMKVADWGYHNALGAETSVLNDGQIIVLLKMQLKAVTIAVDNDVSLKKIREFTKKLRRFTNVYAVVDKHKLLPENKMAPCDAGREIWEKLYKERIKL